MGYAKRYVFEVAHDLKSRILNMIMRSDGKWCEMQDAWAIILIGFYFGAWGTFKLPLHWAAACVLLGINQALAVLYSRRKWRAYSAASCMVAWVMILTFVWLTAHEALSIPLMFTFSIVSGLTFVFQGWGGGRQSDVEQGNNSSLSRSLLTNNSSYNKGMLRPLDEESRFERSREA